jgi:hypothetical protein
VKVTDQFISGALFKGLLDQSRISAYFRKNVSANPADCHHNRLSLFSVRMGQLNVPENKGLQKFFPERLTTGEKMTKITKQSV